LEGQLTSVVKEWPCHARLANVWPCYAELDGQLASLAKACSTHAKHRQAVTRFATHHLVWFVLLMV
jgi:hypothetical protein